MAMCPGKTDRVAHWALLVAIASVLGCAPRHVQVQQMIDTGRYDDAVASGSEFVDENQFGPATPHEVSRVRRLVAKAALAKARQILVSELALAEKTNEDKAEVILDEVLAS